MTRCSDCGRLLRAKPSLVIGQHSFGPICAKRYIVAPARTLVPVPMRRGHANAVDEKQLELELA